MSKIKDTIIEEQDTGVNVYGKKTPKSYWDDINDDFAKEREPSNVVETYRDDGNYEIR